MSLIGRLFGAKPAPVARDIPPFGAMRFHPKLSCYRGPAAWLGVPVQLTLHLDYGADDPEPALLGVRRLFAEAAHWDAIVRETLLRELREAGRHWHDAGDPEWRGEAIFAWLTLTDISSSGNLHQFGYDAGDRLADHSVTVTLDWESGESYLGIEG